MLDHKNIDILLNSYVEFPENAENNFSLGIYYDKIGQTASAASFYLRTAERTDDKLLQYESLIRAAMCFEKQGARNFTVKGLYQNAVAVCPTRPEGYYLLSRFYEHDKKDGHWKDSFLTASLGENVSNFNSPPLRTRVDYPGKYGILYQKALAAWWCGLCHESRDIFNDLIKNYKLDETHKSKVLENLEKFNQTNKDLHSVYDKQEKFDWGIFKRDQFLHDCFKRDILDNKFYEKFFEVEEGDIVLDVGASVGPFTYSVLNKNPKLVICLEPHKELFKTLQTNLSEYNNVVCLDNGISRTDGDVVFKTLYDDTSERTSWEKNENGYGITLKTLIKEYNLEKVDFLKIDCEGGEYDFFTDENFNWIKNNVKKISGEWHFYREETIKNFYWFRDNYLKYFNNFKIFFVDNDGNFHDIADQVWSNDFCQKYGWVNIYIDNRVTKKSNKLDGFPSVHFCSLYESEERRNNFINQFLEYDIRPTVHLVEKNKENTLYGLTQSHLKMFHKWYHGTTEPYAIFAEDDLSLDTVEHWNFTWKEFFEKLPEHWDCVQLSLLCEVDSELRDIRIKPRLFQHWGTQIYLITREYVKKVLDRQHYNHDNGTFDFVVHGKSFLSPRAEHIIYDSGTGGFVYNFPLFVEEIYKFNSTFDSSQRNENYCGKQSYDLVLNWWKTNGPTAKLDDLMKKKQKIVDFCSFYGPYGSEMLLLRYHVLKGYVDEFVISESSYSHSGIPVKFECRNKIREWGLPEEKFKIIELHTPPDENLIIEQIDELNCIDSRSGETQNDIRSKYARVRDRLSKDALLQVIEDYEDDTVFIHSDIDEILNPSFIPAIVDIFIKNHKDCYFYIPLIYLEGRADLRVHNNYWNCPQAWDWAAFVCSKYVLQHATPVQIRSNKLIPEGIHTFPLTNQWNGEKWTEMGWHFSWMGGKESRLVKKQSWEHRYDSFNWLVTQKYDNSDDFLSRDYEEGDVPPCGDLNLILKNYSKENLPKEIFDLPIVEKFLFPPQRKRKKIVDFFPYYDATGRELLELRIKLFNDYVDEFVICESNKTQSGLPLEFNLHKVIDELNLPKDKIRVIQLEIPEDDDLQIEQIDYINVLSFNSKDINNPNSLRARVRERLQKNSLLQVLDDYRDDTVFICGDSDEIVIPEAISWVANLVKQYDETHIIKIPMSFLEGRADLIVVNKNDLSPVPWNPLFFATKKQLKKVPPHTIRSGLVAPYQISFPSENGVPIPELGWHFTWMGDYQSKLIKCKSFTHYDDRSFWGSDEKAWDDEKSIQKIVSKFEENNVSFISGNENLIYKKYPTEKLPKLIFEIPHIKKFLFPEFDNVSGNNKNLEGQNEMFSFTQPQSQFKISQIVKPKCWIVENFYEDPDAVRKFALAQQYVEGGFGRGFIGRRTEKQFLFPGMKEKFEQIMGIKISRWEEHGMNGRFQNCHSGEPLVYHCDSQTWAGMLYLTPNAPYQCGTTLYGHKVTRARSFYDPGWDDSWKNMPGDPHLDRTPFEPVDVLGNVYNRLVLFDASSIHSASEYFGTVIENSRLWQMFFFD